MKSVSFSQDIQSGKLVRPMIIVTIIAAKKKIIHFYLRICLIYDIRRASAQVHYKFSVLSMLFMIIMSCEMRLRFRYNFSETMQRTGKIWSRVSLKRVVSSLISIL